MKKTRITLLVGAVIFLATLWLLQSTGFEGLSGHERYYLVALLTISGMVCLIAIVRLLPRPISRSRSPYRRKDLIETQKREHFRLEFDESYQPRFVQHSDGPARATDFSCPVQDVSETGISLLCTGIFTQGETVQGEILFPSGRTAPINGAVLRIDAGRTSLHLHCTIDPPLLMAEQREQIAREKERGPQPAVSDALLESPAQSLPSHSPKGICRLKRS